MSCVGCLLVYQTYVSLYWDSRLLRVRARCSVASFNFKFSSFKALKWASRSFNYEKLMDYPNLAWRFREMKNWLDLYDLPSPSNSRQCVPFVYRWRNYTWETSRARVACHQRNHQPTHLSIIIRRGSGEKRITNEEQQRWSTWDVEHVTGKNRNGNLTGVNDGRDVHLLFSDAQGGVAVGVWVLVLVLRVIDKAGVELRDESEEGLGKR